MSKLSSQKISDENKLPRNIFLLGIVSFFADFSSEIYFAVLPFFIIYLGGTSIAIGIIAGVSDGFLSFLKAFFGFISDKLAAGKKKFLYWGYGLPAFFKFGMALVTTWPMLAVIRTLERVGKGIRSAPRDAMIVESVGKNTNILGRAFGFHRALDSFGAVIGSLSALILIYLGLNYPTIIAISAFIALFTLIPIYMVKETTQPLISHKDADESQIEFSDFIRNGATKSYWRLLVIATFHGFSLISYMFFILYTENYDLSNVKYISNANLAQTGIMFYVLFNIIYTFVSYYAGNLADKTSRIFVLKIGLFIYLLSLTAFIIIQSFWILILAFCLYGTAYGFTEGNLRAVIADQMEKKYKATAYGLFHGCIGLALFIGNISAGILYEIKPVYAFVFSSIFAFIALLLIVFYFNSTK